MRAEIQTEDKSYAPSSKPQDQLGLAFNIVDAASIDAETETESQSEASSTAESLMSSDSTTSSGSIVYQPERRRIIWQSASLQDSCKQSASTSDADVGRKDSSHSSLSLQPYAPDSLRSILEQCSRLCRIKWLSARSTPFDVTRGLRNAWNSNKEIHIARNITAVEPSGCSNATGVLEGEPTIQGINVLDVAERGAFREGYTCHQLIATIKCDKLASSAIGNTSHEAIAFPPSKSSTLRDTRVVVDKSRVSPHGRSDPLPRKLFWASNSLSASIQGDSWTGMSLT